MSTIWGSLPTWILVFVALGAALRLTNGGAGAAVAELTTSNQVLEKALHDERQAHQQTKDTMGGEIRDLRIQVGKLEAKTDVQAVVERHEHRAQERHTATLHVLNLIAERLGPEKEAA